MDYLVFINDLAILANSTEITVKQLNNHRDQSAKLGLQMLQKNTKNFTNISETPNKLQVEQDKILKVNKF